MRACRCIIAVDSCTCPAFEPSEIRSHPTLCILVMLYSPWRQWGQGGTGRCSALTFVEEAGQSRQVQEAASALLGVRGQVPPRQRLGRRGCVAEGRRLRSSRECRGRLLGRLGRCAARKLPLPGSQAGADGRQRLRLQAGLPAWQGVRRPQLHGLPGRKDNCTHFCCSFHQKPASRQACCRAVPDMLSQQLLMQGLGCEALGSRGMMLKRPWCACIANVSVKRKCTCGQRTPCEASPFLLH